MNGRRRKMKWTSKNPSNSSKQEHFLSPESGAKRSVGFRNRHWDRLVCIRHVSLEHHTDTFKDTQEDGACDGRVQHVLLSTSDCKRTTDKETGQDGIPCVFTFTDRLDGAVVKGEQPTPDTKVTTHHWRTGLDGRQGTDSSFTVWRVSEPLDTVPQGATDDTHGVRPTEIVDDDNRTWVSGMICFWCGHVCLCALSVCLSIFLSVDLSFDRSIYLDI